MRGKVTQDARAVKVSSKHAFSVIEGGGRFKPKTVSMGGSVREGGLGKHAENMIEGG